MNEDKAKGPAEADNLESSGSRESLRSGRTALKNGDFSAALTHLEAAAAETPNDVAVLVLLARALGKLERPAEAEAIYRRILEQDPTHAKALAKVGEAAGRSDDLETSRSREALRAGRTALKKGDVSVALARLEEAAAETPGDVVVLELLARALSKLERPAEAEAIYRRILEQDPTHAKALAKLGENEEPRQALRAGRSALKTGDFSAALAHLQAAAAETPDDVVVLELLARALDKLERPTGAEAVYRRILEQDPTHAKALSKLDETEGRREARAGRSALKTGDVSAALAHLEAAASETPDDVAILELLARALDKLERPDEAEAVYRRILEQDATHAKALSRVDETEGQREARAGRSALKKGDALAALAHLQAAASETPDDVAILELLARALDKLERPAEAETVYRRILEQDATHAKALSKVGEADLRQGRRSEALVHFTAATAADPDDPKANVQLGNTLLAEWRIDEAEAAFRRVIAVEADNVAALLGLGRCAGIRGDVEETSTFLRAAAASQPENRKIALRIKRLEADAGDHDWNKEVLDATAVLRNPDSAPGERVWAAQLLLAYGVTDIVQEVFAPLEATSPPARRLVQVARQLDRSGLSQPSRPPGQAADPEIEELNALTGVVERLKPGAEALMLVFSGRLNRAFLSLDILHRLLRNSGASLVYLRDLERTNYLGGVVGLGADFGATAEAFRALMKRSGARRLLMFGNCIGCAGALRYGLELGAEAVLGVSPRVGGEAIQSLSPATAAKLTALLENTSRPGLDLTSLYLAAGAAAPRVTLVAGAGAEPEAGFAREMAAKVPGVVYAAMPGVYRECFGDILARGLFPPLVSSFVAEGKVAPKVLEALSQPVSRDGKAVLVGDLSQMTPSW